MAGSLVFTVCFGDHLRAVISWARHALAAEAFRVLGVESSVARFAAAVVPLVVVARVWAAEFYWAASAVTASLVSENVGVELGAVVILA